VSGPVLLHAFGARYDLPAPLWLFLVGAGAVVFLSFLLVLPRPVSTDVQVDLSRRRPQPRTWAQWVFLLVGVLLALAGIFGSQSIPDNVLPTAFWLVFWIALPISIAVVGNYWPFVSPLNLIARFAGRQPHRQYPEQLGYWPAAVLFFLFACGELVFNEVTTLPAVTALIMIAYALFTGLMAWLFGGEAWLEQGEVISVLFRTWGRLGWFRLGEPGRPGFFGGLRYPFEPTLARITFVLLLLVSVSFDGLLATPAWRNFRQTLPSAMQPGTAAYAVFLVFAFIALTLVIWGLFGGFALAVKTVGGLDGRLIDVVAGLVPSVVPIAFGYLVAHNADYLAINGQLLIHQASDPLGIGWNLFGTVDYEPNRNLVPTAIIWYFQIALIIAVHIAAVVLAHNYLGRAARTEPQGKRAELPWIVAMVGYTMSSLWLLAQPIVQEGRGG
jgi:hypothetical protein